VLPSHSNQDSVFVPMLGLPGKLCVDVLMSELCCERKGVLRSE
jgi:hypothetical protein